MERNDSLLISVSYFWSNTLNAFVFGHGLMTITDTKFDPLSIDRKGQPIEYYPPCLASRMGSAAPILKKLMKTPAAPAILTYQSSKRKAARGVT